MNGFTGEMHSSLNRTDVLVIGGGVIGVCCAYYLAMAGRDVTLVEKSEISSGCSYGNAGLVVPSYSIPLAAPGVIAEAIRYMLGKDSPFYIRPRFDSELIRWLWWFQRSSKEAIVRKAIPVLRDLIRASLSLYEQLSAIDGFDFGYQRNGLLVVARSRHGLEEMKKEADLLKEYGIDSKGLDPAEVHKLEPTLLPSLCGGILFPEDAQLLPAEFVRGLAGVVEGLGVKVKTSTEIEELEIHGRRISRVKTNKGNFQPDEVVLAAGAWSPALTRKLALNLPIQAGKGYSVTVEGQAESPQIPLSFREAKTLASPMNGKLRITGILELAGVDLSISQRRVNVILRAAGRYLAHFKGLRVHEVWSGLRPLTPDGLPVVGRPREFENLLLATGHGMLGMSLAPVTGQLIAQLVCGGTSSINLSCLSLDRFCSSSVRNFSY